MASDAYTKPKAASWGNQGGQSLPPHLRYTLVEKDDGWGTKPMAPENQGAWK